MSESVLNILLAFFEGFALIISPCILPILPIVLSASLTGNKGHPFGIVLGFTLIFSFFTLFSRQLVLWVGIDLNILREVSFVLLLLFGFIMLSTYLTELFMRMTQRFAMLGTKTAFFNDPKAGFFSGFGLGGLIGLIWTPCAGPILAAVIVQSVLQKTTVASFFTVLGFGIGAGTPMLFIALYGRKVIEKLNFFKKHAYLLRKILGAIIILSVMYMIASQNMDVPFSQDNAQAEKSPIAPTTLMNGLNKPYLAPEISGITDWINSQPLTKNDLKGKVVLVDFWAYSCINCIRTLSYLNDWYQKYHDEGLMIIGVHSPEFDFEHDPRNVQAAVKKDKIKYPVALDNQFTTWNNFHNRYWPAHYLIDQNGFVVFEKFGEGDYDVTENNIRYLLGLGKTQELQIETPKSSVMQTPETYLGYARADSYVGSPIQKDVSHDYQFVKQLGVNNWSLSGQWQVSKQKIMSAGASASIKLHFYAGKVYAVMGNSIGRPIKVDVLLDGQEVGTIEVMGHTLYTLVELTSPRQGMLELRVAEKGLELYTFTFGD